MTAAEVRAEMEERGVYLTLQGGQLCCRGGRKRVSPALLAALGAVRAELLAILRDEQQREEEREHEHKYEHEQEREQEDEREQEQEQECECGHEREDECEREALMAEIADLPAADQLVILGYLCCRHCLRWLLAKECEPDAEAQPRCIDRADCRQARMRVNRGVE